MRKTDQLAFVELADGTALGEFTQAIVTELATEPGVTLTALDRPTLVFTGPYMDNSRDRFVYMTQNVRRFLKAQGVLPRFDSQISARGEIKAAELPTGYGLLHASDALEADLLD